MKITTRIVCLRWDEEIHCQGYIDTFTTHFQQFRKQWTVCGRVIWSKPLFTEEIPIYAMAGLGCCGFTDWRSSAPRWIHDEVNKNGE